VAENADSLDSRLSVDVLRHGRRICEQTGVDCANYHYLRPILRRLGIVTSAYSHSDFYQDALHEAIASANQPRIAISGTADYAWLLENSPLVTAAGSNASNLEVVVSDVCATPLRYSLIAADKSAINASILQTDIRTDFSLENQDAVIADAFLTQFPNRDDRLSILDQWKRSLRLGGLAITTAQVQAESTPATKSGVGKIHSQNVGALYEQSEYPEILGFSASGFTNLVSKHTTGRTSRIYANEEELMDEVTEIGFTVVDVQQRIVHYPALDRILSYREVVLRKDS